LQKRHQHTDGYNGEYDAEKDKKEIKKDFPFIGAKVLKNPGVLLHEKLLLCKEAK